MASPSHQSDRDLALKTVAEVWKEYFTIAQDSCLQDIHSLETLPDANLPTSLNLNDADTATVIPTVHTTNSDSFTCRDFRDETSRTRTLNVSHTIQVQAFEPHPRYESCAPASRSMIVEEWDSENLRFIPYADDPDFPLMYHVESYGKNLNWVGDFLDPDREMIEIEAVRRLYYIHQLSLEVIDSLELFRVSRRSNNSGLIWDISQRDWPGYAVSDLPELPGDFSPQTANLFLKVNSIIPHFCPSLNCLHMRCAVHPIRPIKPLVPRLIGAELLQSVSDPCSDSCFRLAPNRPDDFDERLLWDADEVEILRGVLSLAPDSLPCDLAVICAKQCWEVYFYRSRIISDDAVVENRSIEDVHMPLVVPKFVDGPFQGTPRFTPIPPANATPIRSTVNATVSALWNAGFDGRAASVDTRGVPRSVPTRKFVHARVQGGSVNLGSAFDVTHRGVSWGRTMSATPPPQENVSANTVARTQVCSRENTKCTRHPPWAYGLGAFARRQITKDALVGEYVGEILAPAWQMSPEIYQHTGMNYCFDLNSEFVIDAIKAGNVTRYLNHNADPNCEASVLYVNGEHRIVLTANRNIARGEELFLDYGEKYWEGLGAPQLE
ncbi:hypothetical protein BD779DRAFT_1673043 [Infundibulicybe gibba]|nr:hypothetical protein BD779DRAFT_1673043 [Infundibulicybe gibba]